MTIVILHAVWQAVSLKGLSYIIYIQCFVLERIDGLKKKIHTVDGNKQYIALIGEMTENCFFFMFKEGIFRKG